MALPQHYIMALLTPFGRLNQFGFAVLAIVLGFAHIYVYAALKHHTDLPAWNTYTIVLFGMLWMKFCILSRRLHDTGSNGFFLVPVLLITAFFYLLAIDPDGMGVTGMESGTFQYFASQGMRIPRGLLIALFVYCIRAAGETGPNGYGPEFGETDEFKDTGKRGSPVLAGTMPQNSYGTVGASRASTSSWRERRRPQGFGRR